jgi:iron complex outermembrane recepter protein
LATRCYFGGESLAPGAFQKSFWRFDASARLSLAEKAYELALIGRNLSNERFLQSTSDKPGTSTGQQYGTVSRPREIILQGTVRF